MSTILGTVAPVYREQGLWHLRSKRSTVPINCSKCVLLTHFQWGFLEASRAVLLLSLDTCRDGFKILFKKSSVTHDLSRNDSHDFTWYQIIILIRTACILQAQSLWLNHVFAAASKCQSHGARTYQAVHTDHWGNQWQSGWWVVSLMIASLSICAVYIISAKLDVPLVCPNLQCFIFNSLSSVRHVLCIIYNVIRDYISFSLLLQAFWASSPHREVLHYHVMSFRGDFT